MASLARFVCAKCQSPLHIDSELLELDPSSLVELASSEPVESSSSYSAAISPSAHSPMMGSPSLNKTRDSAKATGSYQNSPSISRKIVHQRQASSPETLVQNMSQMHVASPDLESTFVVLSPPLSQQSSATRNDHFHSGQTNLDVTSTQVSQLLSVGRLFDLLSAKTDLDHPLCIECADMLVALTEQQIGLLESEKLAFEEDSHRLSQFSSNDVEAEELEMLRKTEEKLLAELKQIELLRDSIRTEMEQLDADSEELDREENKFWLNYNQFESRIAQLQSQNESFNNQYEFTSEMYEQLKKTNVYNDVFHIWHDGPFGTINGFRFGRLPDNPVEWAEINAAWGHVVLLLQVLAEKIDFRFQDFRLIPFGSTSKIEKLGDDRISYELYGSGDLRLFWNRRFDQGMVAFLQCVKQMTDYAESKSPSFKIPYRIEKDKVGDFSIKLQLSNDEKWTKALKYLLTDLKWLLAFCCK